MALSITVQRQIDNAKAVSEKVNQQGEPAPVVEEAPTVDTPVVQEDAIQKYEHRLRTVQGMWDAEKRKWQTDKEFLQQEIDKLKNAQKEASRKTPIPVNVASVFSQAELDELDPTEVARLDRVAQVAATKALERARIEMEEEIIPLRQEIRQVQNYAQSSDNKSFIAELTHLVPDWETVNTDSRFHKWLSEEDEITGIVRQDILTGHEANRDAKKLAKMFKAFSNSVTKRPLGVVPDPAMQPLPSGQVEYIKASDYKKFKTDAARGVYKTMPGELKRLSDKYDRAYAENRIVAG